MRIYRISAPTEDIKLGGISIGTLKLPGRWCSTCRVTDYFSVATDIPEEPSDDLRVIIQPYLRHVSAPTVEQMLEAADESIDNARILDEIPKILSVSVKEFSKLTHMVRKLLQLSSKRLILPKANIGPSKLRLRRTLWSDVIHTTEGHRMILSPSAVEHLKRSGLTGFQIFPVQVPTQSPHLAYEMIVYGDGGWPNLKQSHLWNFCEECGEGWLYEDRPYVFELNLDDWDGSDFFHFGGKGGVYVTERVVQWFASTTLRHNMRFIPPDEDPFAHGPYLLRK